LGGKKVGKNPTDRGKIGTKRSVLTDGGGVPIGLAVEGANRNDFKMARETIERIPVERPEPAPNMPQGRCLDKGYDYDEVRDLLTEFGFTAHIRARGEEANALKQEAGYKARRWVVERTHSWMNRFRRVLIRWDKKVRNYLAFLHLACAYITYRQSGLLG
jgi:putative transposase